ncbi:MAG: PAS domain S-box protein, partial [Candidatus Omnitrophota bacterium]
YKRLAGEDVIRKERKYLTKNGDIIIAATQNTVIRDENGQPVMVITSFEDITERRQMSENMRKSEEKFRAMFESSPNMSVVTDYAGKILDVNEHFTEKTGYLKEEAIGKSVVEVGVSDQNTFAKLLADFNNSNGAIRTLEYPYHTKSGEIRTGLFSMSKIEVADAQLVVTVVNDIIKLKKAEKALQATERLYRAVVEDQTEFICRWSSDGIITFVNDAFCRFFKVFRGDILKNSLTNLRIPQDDQKRIRQGLDSLSVNNPVVTIEHRQIIDGEIHWLLWSDRAIFDDNGRLVEYQSVGRDITKRKLAEQALRNSQKKFEDLATLLPQVIFETDEKGILTFANQSAFSIFGYTTKDLENGLSVFDVIAPFDQAKAWENLNSLRVSPERYSRGDEYSFRRKDGSRFYGVAYVNIITVEDKFVGYRGVVVDINRLKEMEQDLRKAKDVAVDARKAVEQANKAKNERMNSLLHDIRNYLTAIRPAMELIGSANTEERSPISELKPFQQALAGIERISALTERFGEVIKLEKGDLKLRKEEVDIVKALQDNFAFSKDDLKRKKPESDIIMKFENNLPAAVRIIADKGAIDQIVMNLLGNAIKFTNKGVITLSAQLGENPGGDNKEEYVLIMKVADEGIGLSPENKEKLFKDRFQTQEGRQAGGWGLGLLSIYKLVQLMSGDITVDSELGKGTTFTVNIPVELAQVNPESLLSAGSKNIAEDPVLLLRPDGVKIKILAVEDEDIIRVVLKDKMLKEYWMEPTDAPLDNVQGLIDELKLRSALKADLPDVVLLDRTLKQSEKYGDKGDEFLKALQTDPDLDVFKGIKVIIVSGALLTEEEFEDLKPSGFIDKLYTDRNDFLQKIKAILDKTAIATTGICVSRPDSATGEPSEEKIVIFE